MPKYDHLTHDELARLLEARDRQVIIHGQPFEGRVIFSVRQR